jgi:hypothetical protein
MYFEEVCTLKRKTTFWGPLFVLAFTLILAVPSLAAEIGEDADKSSSMQMMERVETIVYGEPSKGGLIERLNTVEKELFGRALPGSISERHSATLNFLEIGTSDQPSMLFKLGVAEWIVGQNSQERKPALKRVEDMETDLDGEMQYGKPLAMRVERLLASLVADPVTFQDVIMPGGTVLRVKFLEELNPSKTKKGDFVRLALTDDLFVSKILVAPKGSLVNTFVRDVKPPRPFGVPSDIRLDFRTLTPLGPQRPLVTVGSAAKKAAEDAQKGKDKGEGAIIGAGAASIGAAVILGPFGLLTGGLVRGSALKIPEGSITFVETSGDAHVSGYPVPESLRIDPGATIRESVAPVASPASGTSDGETIQLPAEQKLN